MNRRSIDDELISFARELAGYPKPTLATGPRRELRRSLMTRELPTRRPFIARFPVLATAVVVLALAVTSGVAAATTSLPGDPAFALKRAVESVQLQLAPSEVARLRLLLEQSDRRLGELESAVSHRPNAVTVATGEYLAAVSRLDGAVATLGAQAESTDRDAALALATAASERHQQVLGALLERVPDAAKPGIQKAIDAQHEVHEKNPAQPGRTPHPPPSHR